MSHLIPPLNLSSVTVTRPFKRIPTRSSSSSSVACFTPPTLESAFDPLPRQGSSRYRRKLEEMKADRDYLLLYRLTAEGKMLKVVRRHDFPPINLDQLSRIHHKPLRLRAKVKLSETMQEATLDSQAEVSHRKGSLLAAKTEAKEVRRVAPSVHLLAAKRLLSTTLSLDYGSQPQKTIKPNSTVEDFVEYYQHRYERYFPRPAPTLQVSVPGTLPPISRNNSPILSLKYVKTSKHLGRLLGQIEMTRKGHRKADSLGKLDQMVRRQVSSLWKTSSFKQLGPSLRPHLSLPELEAQMSTTQQSIPSLKQSQAQIKGKMTREMQLLVQQLTPALEANIALSPPH